MVAISLGLLALGACGDDSAPPTPADDGPAGEVIELTGSVTAELAAAGAEKKVRDLAVGDSVFGPETIVTADDASVTIRLFHNNARWTLGAGKRRELRLSAAWKAPKEGGGDLLAGNESKRTAAAGRHAEREAADTRATALAETAAATEAAAAETAQAETAVADKRASRKRSKKAAPGGGAERERSARRAKIEKEVASRGVLRVLGSKGGGSGSDISDVLSSDSVGDLDKALEGVGGVGIGTRGRGGGGDSGGSYGAGSGVSVGKKSSSAPSPKLAIGSVSADGGIDQIVVKRSLRQRMSMLRYCYELALKKEAGLAGKLVVKLTIDGRGKVTSVKVSGDDTLAAATRACISSKLRRVAFPAPADGEETSAVAELAFSVAK